MNMQKTATKFKQDWELSNNSQLNQPFISGFVPEKLLRLTSRLDVGCGIEPTGTVNCDLYIKDIGHRGGKLPIDPKDIPNFVLCDAEHLPFRNDCFEEVYSKHVIEHVDNPGLFFRETVESQETESQFVVRTSLETE